MVLALLLCAAPLAAQSCYIQVDDATGLLLPPSQLAELEAAACELRAAFPAEFQGDFAVYDFGFYPHQERYEGGVPGVFQAKVAEVEGESAYFLLFGRELSRSGGIAKVWVEFRLPEEGAFECTSELKRAALKLKLQALANENIEGAGSSYILAEQAAASGLKTFVDEAVACCDPSNRSSCSLCLEEEQVFSLFGLAHHTSEYTDLAASIDLAANTQNLSAANYKIKEALAIEIQDGGSAIRLAQRLADYFSTEGKEVYWDVLVISSEICTEELEEELSLFLASPSLYSGGLIYHKALVAANSEGKVRIDLISHDWMYHPLNLSGFDPVPHHITHPECPVLKVRSDSGDGSYVPFAGYTPAGTLITLPAGIKASFQPRDGLVNGKWPGGCIDGFVKDGKLYWGTWDVTKNLFLGYACVNQSGNSFVYCDAEPTLFIPSGPSPELVVAALAVEDEGCKVTYHARIWEPGDEANIHVNVAKEDAGQGLPVLATLSHVVPQPIGPTVILPNERCLGKDQHCLALYKDYMRHAFFNGHGPISRAVNNSPCLISTLMHHNFNVIYDESEFTEGLKNITAALLAFGYLPAVMPVFAEIFEIIGAQSVKDGAIGFSIDLSLQVVFRYLWPEGESDRTWQEAADLDELDYFQATASGFEGVISAQFSNVWAGLAISAATSCFVDGYTQHGQLREGFSPSDCAKGVISALVIGGFLNSSPHWVPKLQAQSKAALVRGIAKLKGEFNPSVHLPGAPEPPGLGYKIYQLAHGNVLQANDVEALFDIAPQHAAYIAQKLESNPALKNTLVESDWWVSLRAMASSPNLRGDLLKDLADDVNFANALKAKPAAEQAGLVGAWESALSRNIDEAIRRNPDFLEMLNKFPFGTGKKKLLDDATDADWTQIFSGKLVDVPDPDPNAAELVNRFGGRSGVKFDTDPSGKEFDLVSETLIGEHKMLNSTSPINSGDRYSYRIQMIAAKKHGKEAVWVFEGVQNDSHINKVIQYANEYQVNTVIELNGVVIHNLTF
jgi:hypothetical protein